MTPAPVPSGGLPNRWKLRQSCAQSPSNHYMCCVFAPSPDVSGAPSQASSNQATGAQICSRFVQGRAGGGRCGRGPGGGGLPVSAHEIIRHHVNVSVSAILVSATSTICTQGKTKVLHRWLVRKARACCPSIHSGSARLRTTLLLCPLSHPGKPKDPEPSLGSQTDYSHRNIRRPCKLLMPVTNDRRRQCRART